MEWTRSTASGTDLPARVTPLAKKNKAIASMASDSSKSRPPLTAVPSRGNLLRIEAESPAHRSPVPSDASPGEPFSLPTRIFGP